MLKSIRKMRLKQEEQLFEENFDSPFHPQLKTVFSDFASCNNFTNYDDFLVISQKVPNLEYVVKRELLPRISEL